MVDLKHRAKRNALAAALALVVTACTTATPYQPYQPEFTSGVHGGYSEQRLQPDRYLVRFHGNELTSRERVEAYLLYRAAELTVQNGYDWFAIIDRRIEHDVQTIVRPDPFYRPLYGSDYPYWRPYWRYYSRDLGWETWYPGYGDPFWADRVDVSRVESFEALAEVKLGRGPIAGGEQRAFGARQVMARLAPTIELPRKKRGRTD
jgi:hypothetical protein